MNKAKTLEATYQDNWYNRIAKKHEVGTGTIIVKSTMLNGREYWDVKWFNSNGIVVADGCAPATDKSFDSIRNLVKETI